jgi:hypothetical protein
MQYGRRTLHPATAGTSTLRAAPDGFVTSFLPVTDPQKSLGKVASRRDASPGRKAPAPLRLHSGGMHPVYGWLMRCKTGEQGHRRLQSCRNAKEDGDGRFYRAMHPSGMPLCRGFFVGLSLVKGNDKNNRHPRNEATKPSGAARSIRVPAAAV